MRNYALEFIKDEDLFNHVKKTVLGYSFEINLSSFNKINLFVKIQKK